MMQRILVVDDDRSIVDVLTRHLDAAGFASVYAYDGAAAVGCVAETQPDLILLEVVLPDIDGLDLARRFCAQGIPVIIVTAQQDSADRLLGLELGADDYITKPFSPREVIARIKTVLRRSPRIAAGSHGLLSVGTLTIDTARRVVSLDGAPANLTRAEFEIVLALAKQRGAVCSRTQLLNAASSGVSGAHEKTVDAHIKNIRRKLGIDARCPDYIKTVNGLGYRL